MVAESGMKLISHTNPEGLAAGVGPFSFATSAGGTACAQTLSDQVAAVQRHDQAGAQFLHEAVQAVEEPVGVLGDEGTLDITMALVVGDPRADMRQADEQRHAAGAQGEGGCAIRHRASPGRPARGA